MVLKLVPHNAAGELALWIPVAASAGFCGEYIFRGYFQQQFSGLTGSAWVAVIIQAVFFGLVHGYQGAASMLVIFCLGLIFGIGDETAEVAAADDDCARVDRFRRHYRVYHLFVFHIHLQSALNATRFGVRLGTRAGAPSWQRLRGRLRNQAISDADGREGAIGPRQRAMRRDFCVTWEEIVDVLWRNIKVQNDTSWRYGTAPVRSARACSVRRHLPCGCQKLHKHEALSGR